MSPITLAFCWLFSSLPWLPIGLHSPTMRTYGRLDSKKNSGAKRPNLLVTRSLVVIALHSHCYAPKADDAPREPLKGCAKVKHWVVEHYCTATIALAIPSTVLMGELFIAKYMHDWDTKSMKAHALDRSILAFLQFILTLMGLHIDTCYCIRKLQQINHTMSSMVELQPLNRNGGEVDNEEKNDDNDDNPVNLIIYR